MPRATVWLAILSTCAIESGGSSGLAIFQLQHSAWTAREGVPSPIFALAQTTDGFLWLGAPSGLFRFDGVRFEHYQSSGEELAGNDISNLLATPDGGLWIGYRFGGADFLKDARVVHHGVADGFPPKGTVRRFAADRDGRIWAVANGQVLRFDGSRWEMIWAERSAVDLIVDRTGTLWVATPTAVFAFRGGHFEKAADCDRGLYLAEGSDGTVWLLEQRENGDIRPLNGDRTLRVSVAGPERFLFDREGALWAVANGGILRALGPRFSSIETFGKKDGATGNVMDSVLEDRDGNIWTGGYGGLDRFRRTNVVPAAPAIDTEIALIVAGDHSDVWARTFSRSSGLISVHFNGAEVETRREQQTVDVLYRDPQGTIWAGSTGALSRFENGRLIPFSFPRDLVQPPIVQAIARDQKGNLWVSVVSNGVFRLSQGVWIKNGGLTDLPKETAITLLADSKARVWFGHLAQMISVLDGDHVRTFSIADGFPVVNPQAIFESAARVIWVGGERGLAFFDGSRFHQVLPAGSLEFNGVSGIVETAGGDLWLNSLAGIVHITAGECRKVIGDPTYRVHYELLNYLDGLLGSARQLRPLPTAIASSDGKLWFLTTAGIVRIDPERLIHNTAPPAVFVRAIEANGRPYALEKALLPAGITDVHIEYTAPNLSTPERVRFKYRLEGVDREWHDAGSRREAFYTNLAPRKYRFRVAAENNGGPWNEAGATVDFSIAPAWYQTRLFALVALLSALALCWVAYHRRIRLVASRLDTHFQERLDERVRIAQDLHDTLLQGFISASMQLSVANRELPSGSKAKPIVTEVLELMKTLIEEGRSAVRGMRLTMANSNDLEEAFTRIRAEGSSARPINFRVLVEGAERSLHALVRDDVYRIGREAIINAFRHSGGATVEVEPQYTDRALRLVVRDDGCGIEPQVLRNGRDGHWGLPGMRDAAERIGARLRLQSRFGAGTEIELTVPARTAFIVPRNSATKGWRRFFHRQKSVPSDHIPRS